MKKFLIVFWSSSWGGGGGGGGGTAGFVFFGFCFVPVVGSVGLGFLVFGFVPVGFPVGVGGGWGCGGFLFNIRAAGFRESFLGAHWGVVFVAMGEVGVGFCFLGCIGGCSSSSFGLVLSILVPIAAAAPCLSLFSGS